MGRFTVFLSNSFNIPVFLTLIVILLLAMMICMKISRKYHLYEITGKRNRIIHTKKESDKTWRAKEGQQTAG